MSGCHVIAAYILIQTDVGTATMVAAALREVPGVLEAASVAGPYDVIARAQAPDIDELAKLAASQVQDLDGVTRTLTCPVVHL
jgi:DNA-binding Lrp family transcriptional regulator